tara:strand:+ start:57 stop:521 length:465 start_codon:yes stop_codon:yes gene_type:complete
MPTKSLDNSSTTLLLSEVLRKVSNAKTKDEKIKILRDNNSAALRALLIWNFDDSIKSAIPDGDVPYTPNDAPAGTDHSRLSHEYRGFYRFCRGGDNRLSDMKRESMFIQLLEGLHKDEAELVCLVKDGNLNKGYKRITKAVVSGAFPQIEWGGR